MTKTLLSVAAIAGAAYLLTRESQPTTTARLIAQGASGRIGGATWEVFTDDERGGYSYRVKLPQGDSITDVEFSGEPFGSLEDAISAAEADARQLCDSPVFSCDVTDDAANLEESPFEDSEVRTHTLYGKPIP